MISKNRIKFVQSLHKKKYRQKYGQFTVEGEKSIAELINGHIEIDEIFASGDWINRNEKIPTSLTINSAENFELQKLSYFNTPSSVIAVADMPIVDPVFKFSEEWVLALDGINDPGNLGAIIRIADWYGIGHILCSTDTVDMYNPKSIAATMGSFTRITIHPLDLVERLSQSEVPIYLSLMDGKPIHKMSKLPKGVIVVGSEAHGIGSALKKIKHEAIRISRIGEAESLNAAIATGILCDRLIQE